MFAGNIWEKLWFTAIFALMAVCLLVQFSQVMICFDDYVYYFLSYKVESFHSERSFIFSELFQFQKKHYIAANRRLLYFRLWLTSNKLASLTGVRIGASLMFLCVSFLIL